MKIVSKFRKKVQIMKIIFILKNRFQNFEKSSKFRKYIRVSKKNIKRPGSSVPGPGRTRDPEPDEFATTN